MSDLAQALFQSRSRTAVLELLLLKRWTGSTSELARRASLSPRAVANEVNHLESLGLVSTERMGAADVVRGNLKHPAARFLVGLLSSPSEPFDDSMAVQVRESLAGWGAPLGGTKAKRHFGLTDTLLNALQAARCDGTTLRVLPSTLARHLETVDWADLKEGARRRKLKAELGWLVELTGLLLSRDDLKSRVEDLQDRRRRTHRFFPEVKSSFEQKLARSRSPATAKRWGFWMNASEESFRSTLERHRA